MSQNGKNTCPGREIGSIIMEYFDVLGMAGE